MSNTRFVIAEISDSDFDKSFVPPNDTNDYGKRYASRGILIHNGKVAVLFVSKHNYHKLPGGGIEGDETSDKAFVREIKEETGCECKIHDENNKNAVVLETRHQFKLFQTSYAYYSEVIGEPQKPQFEQSELDDGFELKWIPIAEVIKILEQDQPNNYEGNFIKKRDLAILNYYKDKLV